MQTHVAIVGKTGSGKTYSAKGLVERLLDIGRRVVVLDPTGAWWGLRSKADGTAGYPIAIIGGEHGDVPLVNWRDADKIVEWLVRTNAPAVIDLSEFLISQRHKFVEAFAAGIYQMNRTPLHLVVDEADEFMPQNPMPDCKRMLGNMDRIVRRGRIKGFRVTMITQRPAVLNKNVLTQANTLVAMKLMAPQDRKAIEAWIQGQGDDKAGKEVLNTLGRLKRGEGWLWAPDLELLERRTFPAIRTFDSSRAPEEGEELQEPGAAAALDVAELRALMTAHDEDEPEAAPARASAAQLQAEYDRGFVTGVKTGRQEGADYIKNRVREFAQGLLVDVLPDGQPVGYVVQPRAPQGNGHGIDLAKPGADRTAHHAQPQPASRDGKRRILVALAQFPEGLSQQRLAMLAQLVRGSGTWTKYLGALRSAGLIDGSDTLTITAKGLQQVGPFDPLPTGEDLRRWWAEWLGDCGERRIFETLLAAYPKPMSPHQCAARSKLVLGSGTWTKYLGRLRSLKLVHGRGELKASQELFQ